jgi:S1-C subfamily serine protease
MPRFSLLSTTAFLSTSILLVQNLASAKSSAEIGEIATGITIEIKPTDSHRVGSGIILQHQGDLYTVLTVAHVVAGSANFLIRTDDGQVYRSIPGSVRRASSNMDLAVLRFRSSKNHNTVKIGTSQAIKVGVPLYIAGFPASTYAIEAGTLNFTEGKVIGKATKANKDGYSLIYSNTTMPGMSGGPVLNEAGELVAIHGQGDRVGADGGGEKTGRNLGILVEHFGLVAQAMGIKLDQPVATVPTNQSPTAADYVLTGDAKTEDGDYPGALADYSRSLALDPTVVQVYDAVLQNALSGLRGVLTDRQR